MVDRHAYHWVDCFSFLYEREVFLCMRLSLFGLEISYALCGRWRIFLFDEDRG